MKPANSWLLFLLLPLMTFLVPQISQSESAQKAEAAKAENEQRKTAAEIDAVHGKEGSGICRIIYTQPARVAAPTGTTQVEADEVRHVQGQFSRLSGNVLVTQDDLSVAAEQLGIDGTTGDYSAEGDVTIRQPDLLLKGSKVAGNVNTGAASLDGASFLLHDNRIRGTAGSLTRSPDEVLTVRDGQLTTCAPGSKGWLLEGGSIELNPETGQGKARNVKLRIGGVPVLWLPYLQFPVGDERQSGLLMPSIGRSSRGGLDVTLPWYFNLAPNYDLIWSLRSIEKRGLVSALEFRHLGKRSRNFIGGVLLPDDREYIPRPGTIPPTAKADRWLTQVNHQGQMGNWTSQVNWMAVSDIDYLNDLGMPFAAGPSGGLTGQNISGGRSPALLRTGSLAYQRGGFKSLLEVESHQTLNQNLSRQYETLPALTLSYAGDLAALDFEGLVQATRFDLDQVILSYTAVPFTIPMLEPPSPGETRLDRILSSESYLWRYRDRDPGAETHRHSLPSQRARLPATERHQGFSAAPGGSHSQALSVGRSRHGPKHGPKHGSKRDASKHRRQHHPDNWPLFPGRWPDA